MLAQRAREAIAEAGRFNLAASGGTTPWPMYEVFAASSGIEWKHVHVWQVDERIAPGTSEALNVTHLRQVLPRDSITHAMPVNEPENDLEAAAVTYAATLPERFDVVHLGLGADGHVASLTPEDPALGVQDRDVAIAGPYQGVRRMTLTYPALARADLTLFLVLGIDKRTALSRLLAGDERIPASKVTVSNGVVFADIGATTR